MSTENTSSEEGRVEKNTEAEESSPRQGNHDTGGDTASESEEEAYFDDDDDMPLLKYARLVGSLPRLPRASVNDPSRPFSVECTSVALGKVVLSPEVILDGTSGDGSSKSMSATSIRSSDLVWKYPHYLLAMGFKDGTVSLVDAHTAAAIATPDQLVVGSKGESIVDVCFDASGTFLAAINTAGVCAIWELRFTATRSLLVNEATEQGDDGKQQQGVNPFSSFLTNLTGPSSPESKASTTADSGSASPSSMIMATSSIQVQRISYPASFGRPTAFKIDPSYKRKREKGILVGFSDGRLIFTKRGFVFQRRNDMPIYQGVAGADYQGIEAIAWRGALAAWADANGIKIYDADNMVKIAHIDRPTGARAALYPTISSLRPSLLYETSDSLLVAWGDCVMSLTVQETIVNRRPASDSTSTPVLSGTSSAETTVVKKRTVSGSMAWELDCVACGVAPLDEEHLVILGLVPPEEDEGEQNEMHLQDRIALATNDLEMQVVSRAHGTITYADALPILRGEEQIGVAEEASSYFRLVSTFAVPRAEDAAEAETEQAQDIDEDQDFDLQVSLFGPSASTRPTYKDPHLKWSLSNVSYHFHEDDMRQVTERDGNEEATGSDMANEDDATDAQSVDSDDYSFVLRPWSPSSFEDSPATIIPPPAMVVCGSADAILVRTREIDDAISHALSAHKRGLALRRALQHKRHLRQYDLNLLIDEYLSAVLRMSRDGTEEIGHDETSEIRAPRQLSIRRLQLAAEAMPMLLGGHVRMWEKWTEVYSRISGGLFVLREHLPVRDPVLPADTYETALLKMLDEVEQILTQDDDGDESGSGALLQLLGALKSWGPIQHLREMIRLYKYFDDLQLKKIDTDDLPVNVALLDAEKALDRRLRQTSAGYLQLRSAGPEQVVQDVSPSTSPSSDAPESLIDIEKMLCEIAPHAPMVNEVDLEQEAGRLVNNQAALEACAELNMMRGRYELSLKCFLAVGDLHAPATLDEIETYAIDVVNGSSSKKSRGRRGAQRYGHVLAMIEYHHLHQCLLDEDFSSAPGNARTSTESFSSPLITLMRLIGLESVGDFLVEHCVPPPAANTRTPWSLQLRVKQSDDALDKKTNHTLPINVVAEQLSSTPKLLHWYLHLIFQRRPEMYVKFPSTAVPPRSVTDLHRSHLDLYIKYTDKRDSSKALENTEVYNLERMTTPLLSFLKAALPLGGIRPEEVRRLLEAQRSGTRQGVPSAVVQEPNAFAIELAYVIEHFGDDSEEEARTILDLYLTGSKSLMLAVAFAQRNTSHGPMLWDSLIKYCLKDGQAQEQRDGSLFGTLLECAALSGADLAHLVTQIPQGMRIEGLRPRLVAAVADYRLKLKMHESASDVGVKEKIVLMRELAHRSRRGMRFQADVGDAAGDEFERKASSSLPEGALSSVSKPIERPSRYRLSFALPIR